MSLRRIPVLSVYVGGIRIPIPAIRGEQGPKGDPGTGVNILGSYPTYEALVKAHPTGNPGDAYLVKANLYVWSATDNAWKDVGNIQGPKGDTGPRGPAGATYTLPAATASTLGGVKAGDNVTVSSDGTLSSSTAATSVNGYVITESYSAPPRDTDPNVITIVMG